jgi:chromosome segregation ATPase
MKSTLSQPVRDSANVEGTIKDQLTRIHELEDEVNELQHAMSNTASQLTAARSEAHRWRCVAEARIKEVDSARDQNNAENMEEMHSLRQELREVHKKLEESQQQLINLKSLAPQKDSMTELVNVLRSELEEKDKQIDAYGMSLHELKVNQDCVSA